MGKCHSTFEELMASVSIDHVKKRFGEVEILHGVSIDIPDGSFTVLVGPSGCGKSTLLRMVAGLENISEGTISIGDRVVNQVPPKERDIAMVFQNYALYPHMTVRDNMAFSLALAKVDAAKINARVDQAAGILGLTQLLDRFPRQLSGGQRQRVAMGRAIVRDPQVFLFDEPLSNLDAKLRVAMRSEIKELHQRLKTTSIYVTHDQIEAMTMADQIVVMHDGIIEQIGSPLELYDHPQNKFVAGFIGSPAMNFISGTYRSGDRPMFETHTGERLMLPELIKPLTDGQAIDFGVRPEHLDFADDGLSVEVSVIEPTGSETMVLSHLGKQDLVAVFRERHAFAPGQKVNLRPRIDQCHVFDPVSGNRVSA
jgi:multiple sugar transport system ATP-binding protein